MAVPSRVTSAKYIEKKKNGCSEWVVGPSECFRRGLAEVHDSGMLAIVTNSCPVQFMASLAFCAASVITYVDTINLMVLELKLRKVGNSVGVVLPKEALSYLKVGEGDLLCVTEASEGSLRITPAKADFNRQMQTAQDVVARYRNTLRELAK